MKKVILHNKILIIILATIFIYVAIRAFTLSFTFDESHSYSIILGNFSKEFSANNHLLNTLLMDVSSSIFGTSELALRLPNVLSFGLYLICVFIIIRKSPNILLVFLSISLLGLNPFLLDFFSLARGYGLSIAFMMMSLLFLLKKSFNWISFKEYIIDCTSSLIFASLAIFANLSLINYLIAVTLIFIGLYYSFCRKNKINDLRYHLIFFQIIIFVVGIPLIFGIRTLLFFKDFNQLYFGVDSFFKSIDSLINGTLYFSDYPHSFLINYFVTGLLLLGITSMIIKKDYFGKLGLVAAIITTIILGLFLEHYLFDAKFPKGRTGLFFIPLFGLYFFYLTQHVLENYASARKIIKSAIILICFALLFHFISNINFRYTKSWFYDSNTKEAMRVIEEKIKDNNELLTIGNDWKFEPTINFYIETRQIKLKTTDRNDPAKNPNFIYDFDKNINSKNYLKLKTFESTETTLLMKRD